MQKPTVLITNDDGIHAHGLKHLVKGLKDFFNVIIVAPAAEQSGVGLCVSLRSPLHIDPVEWEDNTPAWQVSGTPADCVRIGVKVLLKKQPDLILSGINKGGNSGRNILYSGTVGGIIDGAIKGIPGIAFSSEDHSSPEFHHFEDQILPLVRYILEHPLPKGNFLNVTFPSNHKNLHKGYRLAKQGMGHYKEKPLKGIHPEGKDYYWMGCDWEEYEECKESDISLLKEGYITAVPVQVIELTNRELLSERKEHFESLLQLK
jgi:5'-nucleotidase